MKKPMKKPHDVTRRSDRPSGCPFEFSTSIASLTGFAKWPARKPSYPATIGADVRHFVARDIHLANELDHVLFEGRNPIYSVPCHVVEIGNVVERIVDKSVGISLAPAIQGHTADRKHQGPVEGNGMALMRP
jgi:hypothetical protein